MGTADCAPFMERNQAVPILQPYLSIKNLAAEWFRGRG